MQSKTPNVLGQHIHGLGPKHDQVTKCEGAFPGLRGVPRGQVLEGGVTDESCSVAEPSGGQEEAPDPTDKPGAVVLRTVQRSPRERVPLGSDIRVRVLRSEFHVGN